MLNFAVLHNDDKGIQTIYSNGVVVAMVKTGTLFILALGVASKVRYEILAVYAWCARVVMVNDFKGI